ncbi:MAG: redoxin domain-containing protein [Candidatus Hodarchaeales archaeon]
MKNITLLIGIILAFCYCTNSVKKQGANNQFVITANVTGPSDSTVMYIKDLEKDEILDTEYIIDGKFEFVGTVEHPTLFEIGNTFKLGARRYYEWIWIENADITLEGDFDSLIITGSETQAKREELNNLTGPYFYEYARLERKEQKTEEDLLEIQKLKGKRKEITINFIKENPNSYATARKIYTGSFFDEFSEKEIEELYDILSPELKQSTYGQGIKIFIDLPELPEIGDKYVDFALPNPDGDTVRLSDFEGKNILVVFWVSNVSCRKYNPSILQLYIKYHPLGLQTIAVSDDKNRNKWNEAIKEDSLIWTNVSNLRGPFNEASRIYRIKGSPTLILIDKNGMITFRDYSVEELEKALEKLFGKEE